MSTCVASKDKMPPKGIVDFFRKLGGERCGAPAERVTAFGPLCEACYQHIEEGRKNRTNLLGIIEEYTEKHPPPQGFFNPPSPLPYQGQDHGPD